MINEIDISDWQMISEPLEIKELNTGDLFSFDKDTFVFQCTGLSEQTVSAQMQYQGIPLFFTFPNTMKVFKWKKE
jgi:hypothetical protein